MAGNWMLPSPQHHFIAETSGKHGVLREGMAVRSTGRMLGDRHPWLDTESVGQIVSIERPRVRRTKPWRTPWVLVEVFWPQRPDWLYVTGVDELVPVEEVA